MKVITFVQANEKVIFLRSIRSVQLFLSDLVITYLFLGFLNASSTVNITCQLRSQT
jgi:hypothetical protein